MCSPNLSLKSASSFGPIHSRWIWRQYSNFVWLREKEEAFSGLESILISSGKVCKLRHLDSSDRNLLANLTDKHDSIGWSNAPWTPRVKTQPPQESIWMKVQFSKFIFSFSNSVHLLHSILSLWKLFSFVVVYRIEYIDMNIIKFTCCNLLR